MICPTCASENPTGVGVCISCGHKLGSSVALKPGSVIASRYELQGLLGKGGMGMVFKAHDRMLDETVAIKVLRADIPITNEMAQRFRAEIKLARRVAHKNVCRIHEYGEDAGLRYISMGFVDGTDLKRILREQGPFRQDQAFDIALTVAEAIAAIHEEGIIHRDLKTANVMRDGRGVVRLMDFGIAKEWGQETHGMTATGQIIGTPEYMSPEQAQGLKLDFRSDIYALGVIVFELFTGRVPFQGDTPIATILKHVQQLPPLEGPEAAKIPVRVIEVLRKALAKRREDRYSTVSEFAAALRAVRAAPAPPADGEQHTVTILSSKVRPPQPAAATGKPAAVASSASAPMARARQVPAEAVPAPEASTPIVAKDKTSEGNRTTLVIGAAALAVLIAVGVGGWLVLSAMDSRSSSQTPAPAGSGQTGTLAPSEPPKTAPPTVPEKRDTASQGQPAAPQSAAPPASNQGFLQLVVVPWADVTIDGQRVEAGPTKKIALAPGPHTVRLEHPDYQPLQRRVTIRARETLSLTIDLPEEAILKAR